MNATRKCVKKSVQDQFRLLRLVSLHANALLHLRLFTVHRKNQKLCVEYTMQTLRQTLQFLACTLRFGFFDSRLILNFNFVGGLRSYYWRSDQSMWRGWNSLLCERQWWSAQEDCRDSKCYWRHCLLVVQTKILRRFSIGNASLRSHCSRGVPLSGVQQGQSF